MFKFAFNSDARSECEPDLKVTEKASVKWIECNEIRPVNEKIQDLINSMTKLNLFVCGNIEVEYIKPEVAADRYSIAVKNAESSHSDLITGEYEGGLKIWECTQDLGDYLTTPLNASNKSSIADGFSEKCVLDLGCGGGLLGLVALKSGAKEVHFQDYNQDVLDNFTIPNVAINYDIDENFEKLHKFTKYYSGDWASFAMKVPDETYDVILTSETIYNPDNYTKLVNLFKSKLKTKGTIYVAAKVYYFGVGGSVHEFEEFIKKDGTLTIESVWKCSDGVQREILKLSK